jgi:glycosyltransferase involved in cell wall biosynthesis
LLLASIGTSCPIVVAERNFPPARPLPWIWRLLRRLLYPSAALHLVQTQRIGQWLMEQGLAQRCRVVPNPVLWPLPRQEPMQPPSLWLSETMRLVLAVGTKPHQKGFDRLLEAFAVVAQSHPDWRLALVGVSPNHPQLVSGLERLGSLRQRVLLPGRVGNLQDWYERADLFVLSSRFEGCPNVLIEAMASACACVAIDCPTGPRELIANGRNGVLLEEPCSAHDLAEAIRSLMNDPQRRHALGRQASHLSQTLAPDLVRRQFQQAVQLCLDPLVMLLAPTRRSLTETFVRANLGRLPLRQIAFFGDEFGGPFPLQRPGQFAYGLATLLSKSCTRLGWHRIATLAPSLVVLALIRRHRPGVLLAEFGFHAVRVMEASRWSGVPLVVHFRGSDASADRRLRQLQERYRRLMALACALLAKSEPMKQVLVGFGARPEQVTISPSGADEHLFHGAAPGQSPPHVLFVGRLIPKKGPLDAVQAFVEAVRLAPPPLADTMRLTVVGDGPLRPALEQEVRRLGVADRVLLLGVRAPGEIAALMRQSRCLLLPSRTGPDGDAEGCPVVVLEAQLCGLPVVSTRHAGIPEVVLDGRTGWLSEEGDVAAMAVSLLRLCRDAEEAAAFGEAGREFVLTHYTIEHHVRTVAALLREHAIR